MLIFNKKAGWLKQLWEALMFTVLSKGATEGEIFYFLLLHSHQTDDSPFPTTVKSHCDPQITSQTPQTLTFVPACPICVCTTKPWSHACLPDRLWALWIDALKSLWLPTASAVSDTQCCKKLNAYWTNAWTGGYVGEQETLLSVVTWQELRVNAKLRQCFFLDFIVVLGIN